MRKSLLIPCLAWTLPALLLAQQPPAKGPTIPAVNPTLAKLESTVPGLEGPGFAIAFNDSLKLLAVACEKDVIQVFSKEALETVKTGKGKPQELKGHQGAVVALAWTTGPILASAGADKKLIFWKLPEGKPANISPLAMGVRALAMSPDGKLLASAGEDMVIQLWDVTSGKPGAKLADHKDWINCLAFSADGKQLASGSLDGTIRIWDVAAAKKTAQLPAPPMPAPKTPVDPIPYTSLAFAPDGKTLAAGTQDGPIQFLNLADGKTVRTLPGHTASPTALVFHPAGNVMVSSSKDRTAKVWLPNNNQMVKSLDGHEAWVEGITLIEQGTKIASVSADRTIKIWDMAEPVKKK